MVDKILPPVDNVEKKPRLRTPTLTQALMLPFYKVPPRNKGEKAPSWKDPHLQQLKHEIVIASVPMFVVPVATFFIVQSQQSLIEAYGEHKTNSLAALAAVGATQLVIFIIVVVKYWEDFMVVARG